MPCEKQFSLEVSETPAYEITNSSPLPNGQAFVLTTIQLLTVNGIAPHTFSLVAGAFPSGVSMSSSGLITIATTVSGSSSFTIQATDSSPVPQVTSKPFMLTVDPSPGPAWASLLWGTRTLVTSGSGSASFTPSAAMGASFSAVSSGPSAGNNDGITTNTAVLATVIPWSGTARLVLNVNTVDVAGIGRIVAQCRVRVNGVVMALHEVFSGDHSVSNQNFDFSVQGKTSLDVFVWCESNNSAFGPVGPCSSAISGSFVNL